METMIVYKGQQEVVINKENLKEWEGYGYSKDKPAKKVQPKKVEPKKKED